MPWKEVNVMSLRKEFVFLATNGNDCNFSYLCGRFAISRKTGYKWIKRFLTDGEDGLVDQSRRSRLGIVPPRRADAPVRGRASARYIVTLPPRGEGIMLILIA